MAVTSSPTAQYTVLRHISWETYQRLLHDQEESSAPRFTYDRGTLEIMSPMSIHEQYKHLLELLVPVVAEHLSVEVRGRGSTTFQREDLQRGFEPDACFYIQHEARVRGRARLDLSVDPPPDLVVEIDITHSSLDKLGLYAAFGVPEVWRYDGEHLELFVREGEGYAWRARSRAFPVISADALAHLLAESADLGDVAWLRRVRAWVGTLPAAPADGPSPH